jgi:hypothetical protein
MRAPRAVTNSRRSYTGSRPGPCQPGSGAAATAKSGFGYREWTVTSQVQAMYAPGANNGFLIRDASENGGGLDQGFHSREKGTDNPPQLVISFD